MIAVAMIFSTLFLGGYNLPFQGYIDTALFGLGLPGWFYTTLWPLLGPVVLFIKVVLILFVFVWLRSTLPRIRYDRLMSFGWKVTFPLALLSVLVTAAVVLLVGG
jgi:NADH-quinone oxidoreductase subunit H